MASSPDTADKYPAQRRFLSSDDRLEGQIYKAAAAFGAILYTVVTGDSIVSALTNIISRALNTNI
ncbi:DUF4244 domain-containing protein [Mycolicibacterium mageritense]|uniref:DUF4244 domain-containing protein n=1 Tax=Mycolicibacterium mageritense TaxID=53462 RepID=UPI003C6DB7EC